MRNERPKEINRVAEMRHQEKRASKFLDEELERAFSGKLDRQMLCAAMAVWINITREIMKIDNDLLMATIRKENDELEREALMNLQMG